MHTGHYLHSVDTRYDILVLNVNALYKGSYDLDTTSESTVRKYYLK